MTAHGLSLLTGLLEAHRDHDDARMGALVRDDIVYEEFGTERKAEGREAFLEIWRAWRRVFPDIEGTIEHGFVSGDRVVAETVWRGTFSGDLTVGGQTFVATGQQMTQLPVALVCTVAGDQLSELRAYFDVATLMRQIGAAE